MCFTELSKSIETELRIFGGSNPMNVVLGCSSTEGMSKKLSVLVLCTVM